MDARYRGFRAPVLLFSAAVGAAWYLTSGLCLAGDAHHCTSWHCLFVDQCTHCAWYRTWHGPNVLATPLRGYYIPRNSTCCGFNDYASSCGEVYGEPYSMPSGMGWQSERRNSPACQALEPGGMERLGEVPNDLELVGAMAVGGPKHAGR